jgi:hypothetical protein
VGRVLSPNASDFRGSHVPVSRTTQKSGFKRAFCSTSSDSTAVAVVAIARTFLSFCPKPQGKVKITQKRDGKDTTREHGRSSTKAAKQLHEVDKTYSYVAGSCRNIYLA